MFADVAEIRTDSKHVAIYAEGWQSWSPVGTFALTDPPPQPKSPLERTMGFRPGKPPPRDAFQAEGLLAVVASEGPVRIFAAKEPHRDVPSIRIRDEHDRLVVSADGEIVETVFGGDLGHAFGEWADSVAPRRLRSIPTGWCSWYCYWQDVREDDVLANLAAIERLELPIDVVQIDDGYQATVGDWLERSPSFGPLARLAESIRAAGRIPGIWVTPFLVGARSKLVAEHPSWVVPGADAGFNWNQHLHVLDVSNAEAAEHLLHVFRILAGYGFAYFKLDFLYAGAIPGIDAYREGMRIVREATGEDAILLGCGAPLLPSIGLVDAMRIGPDIGPNTAQVQAAIDAGRSRAWMNGRLWTNDPDCLIVRQEVEERDRWADHVQACRGLVCSSDPLGELDEHGLALTRRLLEDASDSPLVGA
ncbi:MAG TPA: glycoside hydrolase family 36 protein [Gaiellaceae bacterium]